VLPPTGYDETGSPSGIAEAMLHAHLADLHTITPEPGDEALPLLDQFHTLFARPIALTAHPDGTPQENGPYFRLTYEMLPPQAGQDTSAAYVRVTSQGFDQNITRTLQMEFRIDKKIEFAIISPNRIMIGKNVRVEGPLGSRYGLIPGELDTENGDPLVMRSDFYFLDPALDANLDIFFALVATYDADGDGRLRIYHTTEGQAALDEPGVIIDSDGNEYVDDFDLFLAQYDLNGDGWVVYDSDLTNEAGMGTPAEEFADIDNQLARLIDEVNPDRDGDGLMTSDDRLLGYRDGILDIRDTYAKVRGRLSFAILREEWELAHGASYQTVVQGPIVPILGDAPVTFEASEQDMRELTTDMFVNSATWFEERVLASLPFVPTDPTILALLSDLSWGLFWAIVFIGVVAGIGWAAMRFWLDR